MGEQNIVFTEQHDSIKTFYRQSVRVLFYEQKRPLFCKWETKKEKQRHLKHIRALFDMHCTDMCHMHNK